MTAPSVAAPSTVESLAGDPVPPVVLTVSVGPRNAYTDPKSQLRFYRWQGRDLPSVTSVRRMAGLPHGLHQWSIGKVIDHTMDHLPDIVRRIAGGGPSEVLVVRRELRDASTAERDRAAALGTAVHDAAATGKALTEVPPEVAPRLRQYLDWLAVSHAEILGAEFQCWNLEVGYAGTADLLCRFPDGRIWLVDLKTGKGVYAEHALQLIAYLRAEFVGADDTVDEELTALLHAASGMAVLHLTDKDWEFRVVSADPETWRAFRALVAFATWMHDHGSIDTVTLAVRDSEPAA